MPLDAAQTTWLNRAAKVKLPLPGVGGTPTGTGGEEHGGLSKEELEALLSDRLDEEALRDERDKQLALADAARVIKPLKPVLRDALDLQLTDAKGKTRQFQAKDGDLSNSADIDDIKGDGRVSKGGSKVPSKKQRGTEGPLQGGNLVIEAGNAFQMINSLRSDLQSRTVTHSRINPDGTFFQGPPEPLFSDAELADELFTPLVREKILPETFIADNFSKVQKMLDGSNALYKEELKNAPDDDKAGVAKLLKMAVDVGSSMVTAALSVAGMDTKMASDLLEGTTELVKLTIDFGDKARAGIDVKSVTDFLDGLPGVIGPMVGAAVGSKDLGDLVAAAGSAGTKGIALVATSIKERKPDPSALINFVSSIISLGFNRLDPKSDQQAAIITLGDDFQKALADASSGHANRFFELAMAGDLKGARSEVMGVVKDVVLSLPSLTKDGYGVGTSDPNKKSDSDDSDPSDLEEGIEATQDLVKEVTDKVGEDKESRKGNKELLAKLDEAAKAELEKLEKANEKKAADRKQIADDPVAFADDVREKLNKEREEFKKEMAGLNSKVADDKTIEKMLAKIQRDRAIMSVAVMIGKGGFTVAAKFFAPLSIGTEAIAMSMNIAAAVQRAADLRAFVDEKAGARNAVSPYMSSIQNFVDNQANQLTQYSIRIALNGANIAASVAATAYPMAAPAVTVVAAVQSATELIFSVYNENRLSKAWKATKLALDNPGNRRLGLKARKMNPTLAKYTIAYGATIERDPIAISMCDACGITKDALEKENVNAQKVKTFLEVKFEEDGKVVRHYEDKPDWSADIPDPQLKADCVFYTYKVINDGLGTTPEAAKVGKITPPTELLTMIRAVGTELADGAPSDAIEAQLLMMGRLVSGFAAEANRFGPLGEEAADAVTAFGDLADVKQQKLVLRLLKAKQDEATQTRPRSGGGSPPPPQRPPPPPPRN